MACKWATLSERTCAWLGQDTLARENKSVLFKKQAGVYYHSGLKTQGEAKSF